MPATFGIAAVSIAGMARSYDATRLSLFAVPACREPVAPVFSSHCRAITRNWRVGS